MDRQVARKDRLESHVYRELLDRIRFGQYALGERLPSEMELAESYGVSRPVVRAALSKLRDSGLIVSRQGSGSFVNSGVPTDQGGYAPLGSIDDIACYFRFRRTIEAETASAAARNADADGIARLRQVADDVQDLLSSGDDAVGADIRFHAVIAEMSGSRFLLETLDMLRPHWIFVGNFVRSLGMYGTRTGKRMTAEHLGIVGAIAEGNADKARDLMIAHINESEGRVFKGG